MDPIDSIDTSHMRALRRSCNIILCHMYQRSRCYDWVDYKGTCMCHTQIPRRLIEILQPGVAILHTIYAIYHLARSPKGRTPSSSASYMLFAAIVDVGLIPFLVFTALMSRTEYIEPVNATGHWTTLFGSDEATTKITHSTFLISVVSGSLHLVSLIISIYLGVVFRKISRLPPDMNPLEDNLTSRHKRNKSHLSLLDSRMSKTSMGTPTGKGESKPEDPLIPQSRTVPFMLTRHDSHENITNVSHSISNARDSQRDLSASPFYDQPSAHRTSQTNVKDPSYTQARSPYWSRTKVQSHYPNQSVSPIPSTDLRCLPVEQAPIKQAAEANVSHCSTRSSSIYSSNTITTIATSRPASASCRSIAPTSPDSNWIIHSSRSPSPQPSSPRELEHLRNKQPYQPLSQTSPFSYTSNDEDAFPKPLEMNPPTPPIQQQKRRQDVEKRALTPRAGNVRQENRRPGPGMVGIGKARTRGAVDSSGMGGGGRVVSRSGIEVRQGGILPMGGVRAREVSGKVMEEGRGHTGSWM